MKAAVLNQLGIAPVFAEFPDPVPASGEQLLITVKAASVKNLDKMRASGTHYASYTQLPAIVGIDGVGVLADGTRVYAQGITGMIAEKALVAGNNYIVLPDGIDDITAAALPNALMGSALALTSRAGMKAGDVIMVNGATGVTGQVAVQAAKYYGASKIIVTGRNTASLEKLKAFGADEIISLGESDDAIISKIKEIHSLTPIDIVMDYLWGHPIELIIKSLKSSGINKFTHKVKIVTVGEMAGESINLPSSVLRSSAIEILGSGIGSLSMEAMMEYSAKVLPEMFRMAAEGKLKIETETAELKNIETAWNQKTAAGKRLVITM